LHGNYSNLAAELISIKQPDIFSGDLGFEVVGKVTESSTFGPSLELVRRISGTIGSAEIHIQDRVTNRGNSPAPHMLLYHINCGWPLIDAGTRIVWQGEMQPRSGETAVRQNSRKDGFRHCPAPMDSHAGFGEEVAFIDPQTDEMQQVTCGYVNDQLGLGLKISFSKTQLPWLIHWQHWGKNEYVTALEPATNPPIGQAAARANESLILLEPGETRSYDLRLSILLGDAAREFS
jgi:galactose mutarotase-like enzyme